MSALAVLITSEAGIETHVVLGVGHGGAKHLGDRSGGAVRHELEQDQRFAVGAAADLIEHPTHLGDGTADVAAVGAGFLAGGGGVGHGDSLLNGHLFCL